MDWRARINTFHQLGLALQQQDDALQLAVAQAGAHNKWFDQESVQAALDGVINNYLNKEKLQQWLEPYADQLDKVQPKTVGLVMAGNIPLVGFHDLLSILATGHKALVKLSSKDRFLNQYIINKLIEIKPAFKDYIQLTERLEGFDAVIATGSDNTSRYFEHYFGKYPNIIRKNRHSVAILTGNETEEELQALGKDVFTYYGLGCRNVSKLYLPEQYPVPKLLEAWESFSAVKDHDKYRNNLDYNITLLMLNNVPHYSSEYLAVTEDSTLGSRIATLHYEFYTDIREVALQLQVDKENIQCVVTNSNEMNGIPLGQAQQPELWDYADHVNTLEFLLKL